MRYFVGDTIITAITITSLYDGTLVDPTSLTVKVAPPTGGSSEINYVSPGTTATPGIERRSTGVYWVRVPATEAGIYTLKARPTINTDVGPTPEHRVTVEIY